MLANSVAPTVVVALVDPALVRRCATPLASALTNAYQTVPAKIVVETAAVVRAEPVATDKHATYKISAFLRANRHSNAAAAGGVVAQTRAAQEPAELAVPGRHVPVGSASQPHVATKGNRVEEHPDPAAAMESVVAECATRRQTQVGAHRAIQDLTVKISAMVVPDTSRL